MIKRLDLKKYSRRISFRDSSVWLVLLGILTCYALLIIPTLDRLGIGWDETTDFVIAQAYQTPRGLLRGSSWDLSQTRLPMFTVALVFRLFGASNLLLARFTTVLVGGLTLLGIFIYGKDRFNPITGLLAAGLLAINPFFLSFARLAFTESDVYLACSLTWLLVIVSHLQRKPSLGWAVLAGLFLSFAISSKATALVIIPAICASYLLSQAFPDKSTISSNVNDLGSVPAHFLWFLFGWATIIMLAGIMVSRQLDAEARPGILYLLNYSLVFLGWITMLVWAVHKRKSTSHPIALVAFIVSFSLLTSVIFPPEHLGNPGIIHTIFSRADRELAFSPGFILELAAFHTLTIFFKSTPVLGFSLLAGLIVSLTQWRRREMALPLMVITIYVLAILALPLGQTFYSIPLLPILSLLAADQLYRLSLRWRSLSLIFFTVGLIWWGLEIRQCYPDYHLNGYQWVGARPLFGRSSLGYRSIVYVPLDGTQQVIEWLNVHAKAGEVAQLYLGPRFIIDFLAPNPAYRFTVEYRDTFDSKPDYVGIQIGSIISMGTGTDFPHEEIFHYPFDIDVLQKEYEKVYSVQRAFGLEVASIWERK